MTLTPALSLRERENLRFDAITQFAAARFLLPEGEARMRVTWRTVALS
jgi:hypothetical protein